METIDLKKDKTYKATLAPAIVNIPDMLFITIAGEGAHRARKTAYNFAPAGSQDCIIKV